MSPHRNLVDHGYEIERDSETPHRFPVARRASHGYGMAVVLARRDLDFDALRQGGHDVDDQAAAHLSPALHEHINPYGSYSFEVERELGRAGLRPLRDPA